MPKLKTHSGLKKRIKVTSSGKFLFKKPGKNHLLKNKSKRQKRLSPLGVKAFSGDAVHITALLPHS